MRGFRKYVSAYEDIREAAGLGSDFLLLGIEIKEPTIATVNGARICTFETSQRFPIPLNLYCMPFAHIQFDKDVVLICDTADPRTEENLKRFEGTIYINGRQCEVRRQMLGFPIGLN